MTKLKSSSIVNISTIVDGGSSVIFDGGTIEFDRSEKVISISYTLQYQFTLKDIIALKGEPTGFSYYTNAETNTPIFFNIVWQDEGIVILTVSPLKGPEIFTTSPFSPDSRIENASYFDPRSHPNKYPITFNWQGYVPVPHY